MPTVKLDTQRELISLEFNYGSYEPQEYHFHEYEYGDSTCWGETTFLVLSVSSRAPIVRDIAEVRSSFITIDQLQQVRCQHENTTTFIPQNHIASYFALSPARAAVPNPVLQLLCAPQPQSAHCCPTRCSHSPHSHLPYPSCLLGRSCLQSHAHAARCRRRRHRVHPHSTGGCSASSAALHGRPLEIHVWHARARQSAV